jgi:hypothetical protein
MNWVCGDCGRVHDEPPAQCVCGGTDISPAEPDPPGYVRAYQRLTDPAARAGLLVTDSPIITLLFYVLLALAVVLTVIVVLSVL